MAAQVTQHFQKPWKLLVSVCLTRMNLISKELSDIERRYATFLDQIELRESVYNDYEYRKLVLEQIEASRAEKMSQEKEAQILEASRELASIKDQEEVWASDAMKLTIPSTNGTFNSKDTNSIQRHLQDILHCVVDDNALLKDNYLIYPYDTVQGNETLREAAERILDQIGVGSGNATFLSNVPVGVVKIKFHEREERGNDFQGAKVFFTKAQLSSSALSSVEASSGNLCQWLTLNELKNVTNEQYYQKIHNFVL